MCWILVLGLAEIAICSIGHHPNGGRLAIGRMRPDFKFGRLPGDRAMTPSILQGNMRARVSSGLLSLTGLDDGLRTAQRMADSDDQCYRSEAVVIWTSADSTALTDLPW